jgi:D-tyrosyl-tRNA(Tyr) deacylase
MRVVLQRVSRAEVRVSERVTGRIAAGFLLLVGFTHADGEAVLAWMADKVVGLRLFADAGGQDEPRARPTSAGRCSSSRSSRSTATR